MCYCPANRHDIGLINHINCVECADGGNFTSIQLLSIVRATQLGQRCTTHFGMQTMMSTTLYITSNGRCVPFASGRPKMSDEPHPFERTHTSTDTQTSIAARVLGRPFDGLSVCPSHPMRLPIIYADKRRCVFRRSDVPIRSAHVGHSLHTLYALTLLCVLVCLCMFIYLLRPSCRE